MSERVRRPTKILVADERRLYAEGVSKLLEPTCLICGVVADRRELLEVAAAEPPEMILAELSLFAADDFELATQLETAIPEVRILVVGMEIEPGAVRAILAAGAHGYLLKTAEVDELFFAIHQVRQGNQYLTPSLTQAFLAPEPTPSPKSDPESIDSERIRVLIIDDNETTQMVLRAYLTTHDDIEVIGQAEDGAQGVAKARELSPDVVLMDLRMPVLDGIEATRTLLAHGGSARVLALTSDADTSKILEMVRAGALGYLSKEASTEEIARAIRLVHQGEPSLPPAITQALLESEQPLAETPDELTTRELEVVQLIAQGMGNKEIAGELHLSEATVRSHLRNVVDKLDVRNRVELVLYALRAGWTSLTRN